MYCVYTNAARSLFVHWFVDETKNKRHRLGERFVRNNELKNDVKVITDIMKSPAAAATAVENFSHKAANPYNNSNSVFGQDIE